MFKTFVVVLSLASLAAVVHQADAFKIITIQKGFGSSDGAAPAFNPNALLEGVQGAIASKLSTVQQALGGKLSTIQGLLGSKLSTVQGLLGSKLSTVQGLVGNKLSTVQGLVEAKQRSKQQFLSAVTQKFSGLGGLLPNKPLVFRKVVNVHFVKPGPPPTASPPPKPSPEETTPGDDGEPTTTPKPTGYRYAPN